MSRILKTGIAALALALFFGIFTVGDANAQGILNEILMRMDKHNKSLSSLKADLKMVKHDPVVDEKETLEGTLTFLPKNSEHGKYARIDWEKPRAESIAVRGETFESYVPALKTITTGATGNMKSASSGAMSLLSMSKAQLKQNYTIDYLGQEGIPGASQTWHLRLTPKTKSDNKSTDIWVDGDGMPLQVMDTDKSNKTTTTVLTRVKKNERVEGSIFKINPPKGTRVIKG